MTPAPGRYQFRPLSAADLPLIQQWLGHQHVSELLMVRDT